MTYNTRSDYCPPLMEGWQYTAAFVIQFRPETDVEAGRFEGIVEQIVSDNRLHLRYRNVTAHLLQVYDFSSCPDYLLVR
jgi:hypothetical protein